MILLNIFQRLGTRAGAIPVGTGTATADREGTESGESSWGTNWRRLRVLPRKGWAGWISGCYLLKHSSCSFLVANRGQSLLIKAGSSSHESSPEYRGLC